MNSNKVVFHSIDEYITAFPERIQIILEELRSTIKSVAPDAKEKISYQIPAFELNGRRLIYFAAWKRHISIYPIPAGTEEFEQKISQFADGKGTLKFPLDKPLPLELIAEMVKFRVADNLKNNELKHSQ